jgi:hypothetical protein
MVTTVQVLRAELVHRDHLPASSPLGESSSAPKSMGERLVQAVKRSSKRRDSILRSIQARGSRSAAAAAKPEQQQLDAAAEFSVPVSAGNGEYLTQIGLGTPPQTFTAIVDTGSDLLWTQCLPCSSCYPQTGNAFNPARSSTYQALNCGNGLCQVWAFFTNPTAISSLNIHSPSSSKYQILSLESELVLYVN